MREQPEAAPTPRCTSTLLGADSRLRGAMQGTLDTLGVVELLQTLEQKRSFGTLHVECPQRLVDVHFVDGRIAETRDSTRVAADTVLGSQLLKRSLVDEAQLEDALERQEARPRPLGTLLVESGHVKEADLLDVLARQVAHTLVAARLEAAGTYVFVADADPNPVDFLTVDTSDVLFDVTALGSEYFLAIEMLGESNPVLVPNRDYATLPRNLRAFGRDELVVFMQVDGRRTVAEIDDASGLERVTAINVLGKLVEAGVLLVKVGRQSRAGQPAIAAPAARSEPKPRGGGTVDQAEIRDRMEETRNRLKSKAFDAMISGEAALLSRDSGTRPVPRYEDHTLDSDLESMIDEALTEEDF